MNTPHRFAAALFTIFASHLVAQDQPERTPNAEEAAAPSVNLPALLAKACRKMSNLQSVAFSTTEEQNNSLTRQMGGLLGGSETDVRGTWTRDLQSIELDDGDELIFHNGRMVARDDDYDWCLRRNHLAAGGKVPFVFDPGCFFETLSRMSADDAEITRHEMTTLLDDEYHLVSITLEGEAAEELIYSGSTPPVSGGAMMLALGGRLGGMMDKPDITTDLALYIDPESSLVTRLRLRSYKEGGSGGNVVIQVGGAGGGDEDDEEELETTDANGNPIYKKGLPVRQVTKGMSAVSFRAKFQDHDKPVANQVDAAARKLLRMR